jgi:pimeloyl-ACP methyl ester carboxylesterase
LTDYQANQAQAAAVAAEILTYRQEHPDSPIDLVGYSAGGMIALWVAEALPEDVRLRNILLAQPDISPTYDLTESLRRIDGKLVVFYSPNDWVLSAVFSRIFGTMDRQFVVAAGKVGFDLEVAVPDESLRAKVEQVGWSLEWAATGHPGNHMAVLQYRWNKYCVAPYLVEPENLRIEADPATIDPTDGAPAGQSGLPHRSSAPGVPTDE